MWAMGVLQRQEFLENCGAQTARWWVAVQLLLAPATPLCKGFCLAHPTSTTCNHEMLGCVSGMLQQ